jgi:hypothetical protein
MTTLSQLLAPPRAAACVARAHKWEDAYGRLRSAWPCPEPRGSWGCWQQREWQRIAGRRRGSHCIAQALPVSRPPGLSSSRTPQRWHAPCPGFALSPTCSPSSPPLGTCGSSLVQRPKLRRLRQKDDEVLKRGAKIQRFDVGGSKLVGERMSSPVVTVSATHPTLTRCDLCLSKPFHGDSLKSVLNLGFRLWIGLVWIEEHHSSMWTIFGGGTSGGWGGLGI